MQYKFNLANTYTSGYKKGFEDGKKMAMDKLLEICLETSVMLLVDADWATEDIQEFADRFSRGITYNCYHPDEWRRIVQQARKDKDINIIFRKEEEDAKCD